MIINQLNEMAEAASESVNVGNAIIAAVIALAVGIVILLKRHISSDK